MGGIQRAPAKIQRRIATCSVAPVPTTLPIQPLAGSVELITCSTAPASTAIVPLSSSAGPAMLSVPAFATWIVPAVVSAAEFMSEPRITRELPPMSMLVLAANVTVPGAISPTSS